MKDCPQCGYAVDGPVCPKCGEGNSKSDARSINLDWWRCFDTDRNGNRCSKPGSLSESVKGSDRWWCHTHFPMFRSRNTGNAIPPPEWARKCPPTTRSVAAIAEDLIERGAIQSETA